MAVLPCCTWRHGTSLQKAEVSQQPLQPNQRPAIAFAGSGGLDEWAIDNNQPKVFKAGDTFYEPTGCLHGVGRNPSKKNKSPFIAIVLHPEDAKDVVIPEKKK